MSRSRIDIPMFLDIPLEILRDILGLACGLGAVLLALALSSVWLPSNWAGAFGQRAAEALIFVLGSWVVYFVPGFLALFALQTLRRRPIAFARPAIKIFGAALLIASLCALSTLLSSQWAKSSAPAQFRAGGFIGAFLTESSGIGLRGVLGPVGAALLFFVLALSAGLILTEIILRDLFGASASVAQTALAAGLANPTRHLFGASRSAAASGLSAMQQRLDSAAERPSWRVRVLRWIFQMPLRAAEAAMRGRRHALKLPAFDSAPPWDEEDPQAAAGRGGVGGGGLDNSLVADAFGLEPARPAPRPRITLPGDGAPAPAAAKEPPRILKPGERTETLNPGTFQNLAPQDAVQDEFDMFPEHYELPPLDLLKPSPKAKATISREEVLETSADLERTLSEFGIEATVEEVVQGPVVTRYELKPAPGVKVSRIAGLEREIAMALLAETVRIQAPIPGKGAIGVEIPNKITTAVFLREILAADEFQNHKSPLAFGLGKDITGQPMVCDLAEMPHLLIAGATGAGKSVCLNSIIISLLMRMPPDQVKFIMVDPKRVELSNYQDIPHLLAPVVCDARKAAGALNWVVQHMEDRYEQLQRMHVRNIGAFNQALREALDNGKALPEEARGLEPMPYIVVIVDELADLMLVARSEVEESIQRLAQMARAVGIHLILATQRPSVNVITGVIKANFPSRIAFRVSSKVDSRTILDGNGAEALLGRGDMLYSPGGARLYRIQGAFVSDIEVERVADRVRDQAPPEYVKDDFEAAAQKKGKKDEEDGEGFDGPGYDVGGNLSDDEKLYIRAVQLILELRQASVSIIQRRLKIGYARAGRLMDLMEEAGIVGPYQGSKPRDIIVDPEQHLRQMEEDGLIVRDGLKEFAEAE